MKLINKTGMAIAAILLAVMLAVTLMPMFSAPAFANGTVTFPDPGLDAAVRAAISKPTGDIYQSELDNLTYLDAGFRNIRDLTDLEHCTSLTGLSLYANQISNISALSGLTNLTELDLYSNQINNIAALSVLTNLQYLYNNQISDIQPLVSNSGLGPGDSADLLANPLSATSVDTYIPALQARSVTVYYTAPKSKPKPKGKVPKQPPKYERMVACRKCRDVRDAAIKRAGL